MGRLSARGLLASALHASGVLAAHRHFLLRDSALILLYHRVLRPSEIAAGTDPAIFVTTETFDLHLSFLKRRFELVDLDDLEAWRQGGRTFDRPPCAITFDDGWADNFTNAFPLLRRYHAPATIFVITGEIGRPDYITWDQVSEMEKHGIRFGSHTVTHPVVEGLPAPELEWQLAESKRQLHERTTNPSAWFCYPKGYNDDAARREASRHYRAAVTTVFAPARRTDDPYGIPRISIHEDVTRTPALFALRIGGWLTRSATG